MFEKMRLTIRTKIIIGYFIIIVCLGAAIFILGSRIASMEQEMNFIADHDIEVHNLTYQIEKHMLDMETGQRGFVIAGEDRYLVPYNEAMSNWKADYNQLYELVSNNPTQIQRLDEIKINIEQWIENAGEYVIGLKQENREQEIAVYFTKDIGKRLMDQMRTQFNEFRVTEKALTEERLLQLDQQNADFRNVMYTVIILVILLSLIVAYIISRNIVGTIKQVSSAISDMASDEGKLLSRRITVRTRDEIRELGEVTNRLIETYEKNDWLQTSIREVAVSYQGVIEVSKLAEAFTVKLASLLDAPYAVFYLRKQNKLVKTASYASSGEGLGTEYIRIGEGLVGQAALQQQIILLESVPEGHVKISTGLGESSPRHIMIFSVEFENEVEGVIELASFKKFTPEHIQLVEQTRSMIGIAINNVLAQMEVQRLLTESQAMSEELQSQTEELKTQSEELIAQQDEMRASNQALRQSEERLQRQQQDLEQINLDLSVRTEQVESHLRKIEEINEQIEKQNYVLEKQASDLVIASKYKSEFLANMSHELRTPLNSLLILSQILMDNKDGNLNAKQVEFAETIHSSGNDLLRLIDDILDLSKVEAGQMKVEMDDVLLVDIADSLRGSFHPIALNKGIEFNIVSDAPLPEYIYTDVHRLQQILKNLLSNAFKFTSEGQVTLSVHKEKRRCPFNEGEVEHWIAFTVADTGIGIPLDKKEIIFDAFQQADGTTSRKYGGTGLGLTISRELAGLIGGRIEFDSEVGVGSTFTLFIPEYKHDSDIEMINEAAVAGEEPPPAMEQLNDSTAVITHPDSPNSVSSPEMDLLDDRLSIEAGDRVLLIIEDDVNFAGIILDMARSRRFKGIVALQGDHGLALAHAYKPDAIILDIQLPIIDGWTVLERLKQHPELRHIPVHVVSAANEQQMGLTMGAIAYLKKPVNKVQIENALSNIESFINRDLKRLLIVEDDVVLRNSMVELIGHDDVLITDVSTGEEALRELEKERFDCMVMDLGLAGISGFELLDRIRQNDHLKQLPIIIYTGKDLTMKEEIELKKYAESIIIKNVKSQERLFDETALFLHRVEANLPEDRRDILKKLYSNQTDFDGKRILLVEDDIRNIFSLVSILESYGLNVTFAENGREAMDVLAEDPEFDLILMDIMMPEMDGYQTMRAIRGNSRFEKTPIIALTAKAMKEDRQLCIEAGASDYISKPIDVEKLLSLLKVWLYT
ncbi:response regulator [Paenibacillus sp. FSL H7-0326]|uniref:response regulator n=1 Tax=Paenibacillus sp. FSL H7-0326 TaxID=1921144 RepID=UPI0009FA8846|nr:response regulator [Paenibacillus sp. FSL H7-0326]